MIVTKGNFEAVMEQLWKETHLSVDTETTGLHPHKGDVLFSLIIGSPSHVFYFNFEEYEDQPDDICLNAPEYWAALTVFFSRPHVRYFLHNAKFDLAFLRKEGIAVQGTIHDTKTSARLLWNDHMKYSLKDCVKRDIGMEKSTAVEDYVKEHKLYEDFQPPHKSTKERKVFYHKVPFDVISKYGEIDGHITFHLGMHQLNVLRMESAAPGKGVTKIAKVYGLECALIPAMLDMEYLGIKVDPGVCRMAVEFEENRMRDAEAEFKRLTGRDFLDSNKLFGEVFKGIDGPKTAKGKPSFDKNALSKMDSPIALEIKKHREAKNQSNYFHGFLHHADEFNIIHPNFLADGTASGRFSSQNPNLQNLTKPDDEPTGGYEVRSAFTPRQGFTFYIFDYKAQEHRLLVDLSGATDLAEKIKSGHDVHAETAAKAGTTRHEAKVTLFSTLYGAGVNKLAEQLKCTPKRAREIRADILDASPEIKKFIRKTVEYAEVHHKAHSWMGRIYRFPSVRDCYRAPNYVIQGGSADITKSAIVGCHKLLKGHKSRMVLTVHDSIVFEIADGEEWLLPVLREIMIGVYPFKILPMDVSVEKAAKNMAETEKVSL